MTEKISIKRFITKEKGINDLFDLFYSEFCKQFSHKFIDLVCQNVINKIKDGDLEDKVCTFEEGCNYFDQISELFNYPVVFIYDEYFYLRCLSFIYDTTLWMNTLQKLISENFHDYLELLIDHKNNKFTIGVKK